MVSVRQLASVAALALGASAAGDGAKDVSKQSDQSLFWGPYKPNLYFGVRPRVPQGLWTGLIWGGVNTFEGVPKGRLSLTTQLCPALTLGW